MKARLIFCLTFPCWVAIRSALAISGVDAPPAPAPPAETKFAQAKEAKLENGLKVIVVERPGLPVLAAELVVRSGAEVDPKERAGAASMTADLLTKGTEKMSAPEIASAIESLGGTINSGARWDASRAGGVVMSDKAEAALGILADVVLHPTFKPEEIDRLKTQTLDALRVDLKEPGSLAQFVVARVIFGDGAYGHPPGGTLESIQAITREDITELYKTHYTPRNAVLILAGNVTLEQGLKYAEKFFGDWKSDPPAGDDRPSRAATDWEPASVIVDMPDAGQAAVIVGRPVIKRDSPDYYSALVANAALGTGFISRLNREIRIKRGLSYGARSSLEARREVGPFLASAQTKNQSAAEVAGLFQSEMKRLGTEPVEGGELQSRQAVLTGGFARRLETNAGYVTQISALATYGLPLDTLDKFIPSIDAVKSSDVSAFAEKYFNTAPSLVIVGQASEFLEALKGTVPDLKVIPQSELNLNRSDLAKAK